MAEAGNFKYFNMKFTKNFGMHFVRFFFIVRLEFRVRVYNKRV